jgi:hypothetical protein
MLPYTWLNEAKFLFNEAKFSFNLAASPAVSVDTCAVAPIWLTAVVALAAA